MGQESRNSRQIPHPLGGGSLENWLRILWRYGGSLEGKGRLRAAGITLSTLLGTPFRAYESLRYRRLIARQPLDPAPVFIIGHWRSGTTHLHNLMLQDPRWGQISLLQCAAPHLYLTLRRPVASFLSRRVPERRPMDNVPTGPDAPMSEDFAMVGRSDLTHYLGYFFPRRLEETFRRTVLFEGVGDREKRRWGEDYVWTLRKAAFAAGGRPLLLKNPPNTARIGEILRLFPEAKFVHVRRDPFRVYVSTCRLMEKFIRRFSLQPIQDWQEIRTAVLRRYRLLMERYDQEKDLIPPGHLVEVRHEDTVKDPVGSVERIYTALNLPGFFDMRGPLIEYADSIRDYRTNEYKFDPETVARVQAEVGFLVERWGYSVPEATSASRPDGEVTDRRPVRPAPVRPAAR